VARGATLGIFWTKYSLAALLRPGAYAVLKEPLASDYLTQPSITHVAPVSGTAVACQRVLTIKSDLKHSTHTCERAYGSVALSYDRSYIRKTRLLTRVASV
jgi:hypothetical protein